MLYKEGQHISPSSRQDNTTSTDNNKGMHWQVVLLNHQRWYAKLNHC